MASAPIVFGIALVVIIAAVWGFMHWSYRSVLAGKDTHIASLERRLADYRSALGGASPDEARRRIEALQNEVRTLQVQLKPRSLTPSQRQSLTDRSRRPVGVATRPLTIVVEQKCNDCAALGDAFAEAFRAGDNWSVTIQTAGQLEQRPRTGLGIRIPEPTRPSADAEVLRQALRLAGIAFTMMEGPPGSGVELVIAERAP